MAQIEQMYRVEYMKDKFSYVGLLRNAKKFEINQNVFFSINGSDIAYGRIVGIELPPAENPEYLYKIELHHSVVGAKAETMREGKFTMNCDKIFNTIEEAETSAIEHLAKMYKLQFKAIGNYFEQFKKNNS